MNAATLTRFQTGDQGTCGSLVIDVTGFLCKTLELPWRDNQHDISCIPQGTYQCKWMFSPVHNCDLYHVIAVPDRGSVEIHVGNWAGDVSKGFKSNSKGCILVGHLFMEVQNQTMLTDSKVTLDTMHRYLDMEPFTLTIGGIV